MKKVKRDMVSMIVLMGISALFYIWFIPNEIRIVANNRSSFTSRTFPNLLMAAMFFMSLLGFGKSFISYRKLLKSENAKEAGMEAEKIGISGRFWIPCIAFVMILGYGFLFKYIGYLLSTLMFVTAFLGLLRCKNWKYYLGCYLFCGVMYLIFTQVLHVLLP